MRHSKSINDFKTELVVKEKNNLNTMENIKYKIKELESLTGIKSHTIRIWEKRYNLLNPVRTDTNIRRYTHEDLVKIINVSTLYNYGWKISKISELDDEQIEKFCEEARSRKIGSYAEMVELIFAVNEFNVDKFDNLLDNYCDKFGIERTLTSIVAPLSERLSQLSLLNRLDKVIEEFFLNKIMIKIFDWTSSLKPELTKSSKTVLFIQSDRNTIPISLLIGRYLAIDKSQKVILFTNFVSNDYLKRLNELFRPDVIFTEFAKPSSDDKIMKRSKAMAKAFRKSRVFITGKKTELLVKKLPDGVYHIENLKDFSKTL